MVAQITVEEMLALDCVLVDTRSPAEFAHAHIPGAVSMPIFTNEERALVGLLYTREGREKALDTGLELFLPRCHSFIENISSFTKPVVVYCWRGGMRSRAVCSLFSDRDDVFQLVGGHKAYRTHVRSFFSSLSLPPCVVVYGYTGSGKTDLICRHSYGVDLEGCAHHRGSRFGGLGLVPCSQKMFESLLFQRLFELRDAPYLVVEGETSKIGTVCIPPSFFSLMKRGSAVLYSVQREERAYHIVATYPFVACHDDIVLLTEGLKQSLGKVTVDRLLALLAEKDYYHYTLLLLELFYDPLYERQITSCDFVLTLSVGDSFAEAIKGIFK